MEVYELFAYDLSSVVETKAIWEEAVFAGMLERDVSSGWKGVSSNKVFTQEQLNKIVEAIPEGFSCRFPDEEIEDIEDEKNYIELPVGREQAFGRRVLVRRYDGPWPL